VTGPGRDAGPDPSGACLYRCRVKPADQPILQVGTLEAREAALTDLLDRVAQHDDPAAAEALRALVRDYRDHHRALYSRALNHIATFGDASLEQPLLAALGDAKYNCQAWAAMGCTELRFASAVPGLLALLDSPQWIARDKAVLGLGELADEAVVPALAPLLADEADWMRQRAADALAKIGGDAAFEALWTEFELRRFDRIGYLASALALFPPDQVIPRLIVVAEGDDVDLRYWAAVALGSTGDERVAPVLERMAAGDRGMTVFDGYVKVAAKKALRTLRRIQAAVAARG
jgi:HEAT repeat protein